jgi:hypothetical protein
MVRVFSGNINNRWRGDSGCWLPLNPVDADVCFLRNCNCGFAACYAPAAVEALAGVKTTTALRPHQEGCLPEPEHGTTPLATVPAHLDSACRKNFPVSGVTANVTTAECCVKVG